MAYITNGGARLIDRARTEDKSIVFGAVRMNTIFKSDPSSLVQQSDAWFGANLGSVVGCLSHVSVDGASCVCDSKLAIQCNDNGESWKSIGIYAHLEGEDDERLFACESIQNGDYKDVTLVELPVTLDGVVEDFGLSEGGGGGGGGDVPANMMTTDTEQTGLSGMKSWGLDAYEGEGSEDNPQDGDRKFHTSLNLGETVQSPLSIESNTQVYIAEAGAWKHEGYHELRIKADGVVMDGANATWANIILAANSPIPVINSGSELVNTIDEQISLWDKLIPASGSLVYDGISFDFDASNQLASVHSDDGIASISVRVFDYPSGNEVGSVNGVSDSNHGLSFDTPIALAENYILMWFITKAS